MRLRIRTQTSQQLIFRAGIAVIAAGILCLCLSAMVTATGSWWQGTLDAFGVGFVVGGVIDVLAIFGLNQVLTRDQRQLEAIRQAYAILNDRKAEPLWHAEQARGLLRRSGPLLDASTRELLQIHLAEVTRELEEEQRWAQEERSEAHRPPGQTLDDGDGSSAPGSR